MKAEKFEDLICWEKGKDIAVDIYKIFRENKDFKFKDQIQDAVVSISNNIAEGFERKSNKEFSYFCYVSKGSCGEVRSMLYIAIKLGYITQKQFDDLYDRCMEVSKILAGLIKSL